jgi:hypothetical protein
MSLFRYALVNETERYIAYSVTFAKGQVVRPKIFGEAVKLRLRREMLHR